MNAKGGIIYVNFSPYDNAGRILDFLVQTFRTVIHFSYDHLRLQNGRKTNVLTVYQHGVITEKHRLIPLRTPEWLRFASLPIVALLILIQTWWHAKRLKHIYQDVRFYLSPNAYTAWIGSVLKTIRIVDTMIFWVWDYYPPGFPDWRIRFLRWVYWHFDKPSIISADILAFISDKLLKLRHDFQSLPAHKRYKIIPIGTNPITTVPKQTRVIIGFLGMLKESQGLDFLFDALPELTKHLPNVTFEIVGSGPQETYYRNRAKKWRNVVKFYGFVERDDDADKIMRRWSVGLAPYLPVPSNESYWADPSKIKAYLSQGVPVVTTPVPYFSKELVQHKAGKVVPYGNTAALLSAIRTILRHKRLYGPNALRLAKRYEFRRLYRQFFKDTRPLR